jgi:hypothetical protein
MLKDVDSSGSHWIRLSLASASADGQAVPREEWQRFRTPDAFKAAVRAVVRPGTTVVVTADSLVSGSTAAPLTIIDSEQKAR